MLQSFLPWMSEPLPPQAAFFRLILNFVLFCFKAWLQSIDLSCGSMDLSLGDNELLITLKGMLLNIRSGRPSVFAFAGLESLCCTLFFLGYLSHNTTTDLKNGRMVQEALSTHLVLLETLNLKDATGSAKDHPSYI